MGSSLFNPTCRLSNLAFAALFAMLPACGGGGDGGEAGREAPLAAGRACHAKNERSGDVYNPATDHPLAKAIEEAAPGDTIRVWGVCHGNFVVPKDLTLQGQGDKATLDGGGSGTVLFVPRAAALTIKDLSITGGNLGIAGYGGVLTVIRTYVTGNSGTGVANFSAATVVVEDSVISGNTGGSNGCGGGLYNSISATMTIRNSVVSGNKATGSCVGTGVAAGGGIYTRGPLVVENTNVASNEAADGYGGGISVAGSARLNLTSSTVSGNTAQFGGGIRNEGTTTLENSTVSGNSARVDGGGIACAGGYDPRLVLIDSTVSSNKAAGTGGGIWAGNCTVTLTDSLVEGNEPNDIYPPLP